MKAEQSSSLQLQQGRGEKEGEEGEEGRGSFKMLQKRRRKRMNQHRLNISYHRSHDVFTVHIHTTPLCQ